MPGVVLSFPVRGAPFVRHFEGLSRSGQPQGQPTAVPGGSGRRSGGPVLGAWRASR
jgi:hypothetical protein